MCARGAIDWLKSEDAAFGLVARCVSQSTLPMRFSGDLLTQIHEAAITPPGKRAGETQLSFPDGIFMTATEALNVFI